MLTARASCQRVTNDSFSISNHLLAYITLWTQYKNSFLFLSLFVFFPPLFFWFLGVALRPELTTNIRPLLRSPWQPQPLPKRPLCWTFIQGWEGPCVRVCAQVSVCECVSRVYSKTKIACVLFFSSSLSLSYSLFHDLPHQDWVK